MKKNFIKILCGDYIQLNLNVNELDYSLFKSIFIILLSSVAWCAGLYINDVNQSNIFVMIISLTILGWGFWAVSIWYISNRFLHIYMSYRSILRILAFSYLPGILMILIAFKIINSNIIWIISRIWILIIAVYIFKNFANISLRKSFFLVFFGWVSTQIIFGKFY